VGDETEFCRVGRTEVVATFDVGRSTSAFSDVRRRRGIETALRDDAQTELDPLGNPQPVKIRISGVRCLERLVEITSRAAALKNAIKVH